MRMLLESHGAVYKVYGWADSLYQLKARFWKQFIYHVYIVTNWYSKSSLDDVQVQLVNFSFTMVYI